MTLIHIYVISGLEADSVNYQPGVLMWETREVQVTIRLPRDIADQAEEVQRTDPEFLSRVVLYGLTRRSIYRHLRDNEDDRRDDKGNGGQESPVGNTPASVPAPGPAHAVV